MALTIPEKRSRALAVIANGKRTGRLDSNAVTTALVSLAALDDKRYSVTIEKERAGGYSSDSSHVKTHHARIAGAGISLGGEIVAVTDPPTPEDHDTALGWNEPATPESEAKREHDERFATAADLLHDLISWLVSGSTIESIGTRAIALAAATQPSVFDDCAGSTTSIATRFGLTKQAVSKYVSQIRDLAGPSFQARGMRPSSMREVYRQSALGQHRRAGHTIRSEAR